MATMDLPVVGNVDRKWVWIAGGTVAVIVGWAYWRRAQGGPTVIEEGVDGADILPGSEGGNRPGNTGNSNVDLPADVIDTVAEWTADVVQKLAATDWDTGFVYSTIGKWIAGEGLTDPEKNLVRAAIAASGQPPGGPYPIKSAPAPPNPSPNPTPTPTPTPTPVPTHVPVPVNENLYEWTAAIGRNYGIPYGMHELRTLNPGIDKKIFWRQVSWGLQPEFRVPAPGPVRIR